MRTKEKRARVEITAEEKRRWAPILQRTWDYVAYDVLVVMGGSCKRGDVVEFVCDAGRPCENYGRGEVMTLEEYRVLGEWYGTASFRAWTREVFPSSDYCI